VAPYQDVPYGALVDEYVATLGAQRTDADDADVLLAANTSGGGSLEPFVDRIHDAVAHGRLVAIGDDAVAGVVDTELRTKLAPRIDLAELGGWSGWNVGVSLSQSVVRAALLEASRQAPLLAGDPGTNGAPVLEARRAVLARAAVAHQRLLLQELVHTDLYRNQVRSDVRAHAVAAGDDPQHMTTAFDGANALAVERTRPLAEDLFAEEFAGDPMRLGSDGRTERTAVVSTLDALELGLGWPRYQELDVFPKITLDDGATAAPVSLNLLPYAAETRPEAEVTTDLEAVLRNDTAFPVDVDVRVDAPAGWATPEPVTVPLAAFEVREVPLAVTSAPLAPQEPATVEVHASAGGDDITAASTITAVWRNVALASSGAGVLASGSWNQYVPERVIDGNTSGVASRWITETAPAHWLELTLGATEPVDTVQLFQYDGYLLEDYTVSALVDGRWEPLVSVTGNTEASPVHRFDAVETTALRLDVTGSRDGRVRLYEIEVTCRSGTLCSS
jgi:hypothetical protein